MRPAERQGGAELLVGRQAELSELVTTLQGIRTGPGALVGLKGAIGIGKSRLVQALSARAAEQGVVLISGSARTFETRAYGALIDLLEHAFELASIESRSERAELLNSALRKLEVPEQDRYYVAHVLGVEREVTSIRHLDGTAIRWNVMRSIRSCLLALARLAPHLLVFEDMHLADRPTRDAIEFVARDMGMSRSLMLLVYRKGYVPPAYARELVVPELPPENCRELAHAVGDGLPRAARERVETQSEGNPLLLIEACRWLQEGGAAGAEPWPETLDTIIEARLNLLSEEARQVLDLAAVAGAVFHHGVLARVDEVWPRADAGLNELVQRGILEKRVPASHRWSHRFRTALARDVALVAMDPTRRKELHAAVATALEGLFREGGEVDLESLARHFDRGGSRDRAASYALDAAVRAQSRCSYVDAERLFRAFLAKPGPATAQRIEARLELGRVQQVCGWHPDAIDSYRMALAEAQELEDRALEGRAVLYLAILFRLTGRTEEAETLLAEALRIHRELGNREAEARVLQNMANLEKQRGAVDRARELYEEALANHKLRQDLGGQAAALSKLAALNHEVGRLDEALELNERAIAIHRAEGNRRAEAVVLGNIASLAREQGRVEEARDIYEAAIAIHREVGDRRALGKTLYNLANLHAEQGRLAACTALAEQALRIHREVGNRWSEGATLGFLAALAHEQGHLSQARKLYEQAIALQREVEYWPFLAVNIGYLAELNHHEGDHQEAHRLYDESLALHRKVGDRRGEALELTRLANLLRDEGHLDEADRHYVESLGISDELNDRRGEAITKVQLAACRRRAGAPPGEVLPLLSDAAALLVSVGDRLEIVRCLCEQGHACLQADRPARTLLEQARGNLEGLELTDQSPLVRTVTELEEAVERYEAAHPQRPEDGARGAEGAARDRISGPSRRDVRQ